MTFYMGYISQGGKNFSTKSSRLLNLHIIFFIWKTVQLNCNKNRGEIKAHHFGKQKFDRNLLHFLNSQTHIWDIQTYREFQWWTS